VLIVALKTELENIRETHRLESVSQEDLIKELRLKLQEAENVSPQDENDGSAQMVEKLQSDLNEKQEALQEAQRSHNSWKETIDRLNEELKEQSKTLEDQLVEVKDPFLSFLL